MNRLRRDDEVIILAGKDRGKRGTISQMAGDRVTVNGVNMVKRHTSSQILIWGSQEGLSKEKQQSISQM